MSALYILSATRSAVGSFGGGLKPLSSVELGALAVKEALVRAGVEAAEVGDVVLGNVLQAGSGQNVARLAALKAGIPFETPALTINKVCGSGLKAIQLAANAVRLGDHEVVLAGGMESMSNAPYLMPKLRTGARMGHTEAKDAMILDGLWCAMTDQHMGHTGELVADKFGVGREVQDAWAAESHRKALAAMQAGAFQAEIVPMAVPGKKGDLIISEDEGPRADCTVDSLAKLRPAFKKDGSVTAGNASGINDGAAAVLVMSAAKAKALGLTPLARIKSFATSGIDPKIMGMGPVPASKRALAKADWKPADLDLMEINEAFAAQACAVNKEMGWDTSKINVNGGAIALGHPIGASGCRILVSLLHEMKRRDAKKGLASLCIGGGMGVALAVER